MYQIVTGVTSDDGVPSTYLVDDYIHNIQHNIVFADICTMMSFSTNGHFILRMALTSIGIPFVEIRRSSFLHNGSSYTNEVVSFILIQGP